MVKISLENPGGLGTGGVSNYLIACAEKSILNVYNALDQLLFNPLDKKDLRIVLVFFVHCMFPFFNCSQSGTGERINTGPGQP